MGIYCVAKAGLEMLTRVLAVELASDHINVNAVAPCVIRTRFSQPSNSLRCSSRCTSEKLKAASGAPIIMPHHRKLLNKQEQAEQMFKGQCCTASDYALKKRPIDKRSMEVTDRWWRIWPK